MSCLTDEEPHWLALFDSVHYVLAAERAVRRCDLWCDLVPLLKSLSSDCGMALAFRQQDAMAVGMALADAGVKPRDVYRPCQGGYERVSP